MKRGVWRTIGAVTGAITMACVCACLPTSADDVEQTIAPDAAGEIQVWPPQPQDKQFTLRADHIYYYEGATGLQGNVEVVHQGITIRADVGEIDAERVWGQFRGNVTITGDKHTTTVDLLRVNFDTEEWILDGGRTTVEPEYFETGIVEPVYVHGGTVAAEPGGEPVHITDATVTTCDLEEPHYGLSTREATLRGDDTLVMHRPGLQLFGTTIVRYPWDLALSTTRRDNRFFPEFGQNSVEGYYAKLAYMYLAGELGDGFLRLNLSENRGVGLGADHYFEGSHVGELSLFFEPQEGSFSARGRDSYDITDQLTSNLNVSAQNNSGYAGSTTSLSSNLNFRYTGDNATTNLGFDHGLTESTYSTSRRFTTNFSHRQRVGDQGNWTMQAVMRESDYGGDAGTRSTLETDFQYADRYDAFDWSVAADRNWDLEGGAAGSYDLERLPEIVLNTDTQRLGNAELLGMVPFRATVRAGHFIQYPDEDQISMAAIETQLGGESQQWGDSIFRTSGRFNQGFYDDGSARYTVGLTSSLETDFGAGWESRVSHNYGGVHGYSPLRRDYGGSYEDLTFQLVRQRNRRSRVELSSGYDFRDDRYREARLRAHWEITPNDRVEVTAGRAVEEGLWRPVRTRWTHAGGDLSYLALSSYYDPSRGQLTSAEAEMDWRIGSQWRFEALGTYSGYSEKLDQFNLRLTRDLHCWVAALTYNQALNEIRLNLGIKAYPSDDRQWSLGGSGQRLGSYAGTYY